MIFKRQTSLVIRQAIETDFRAIYSLINTHWRAYTRLLLGNVQRKLMAWVCFIVEDDVALRGFIMVEPYAPQGIMAVVAVHDNVEVGRFLDVALDAVEVELRQRGLGSLIHIGKVDWFSSCLTDYGFVKRGEIVTLQWDYEGVIPSFKRSSELCIRLVRESDLADLMRIDGLAFDDVWRKPGGTLKDAMEQASYFTVGLVGGMVVAYQWCDKVGYRGHLSRIATHPGYEGRGIATQMVQEALGKLVSLGVREVSLNTPLNNYRTQAFYKRFGFESTGEIANVYQKKIGG